MARDEITLTKYLVYIIVFTYHFCLSGQNFGIPIKTSFWNLKSGTSYFAPDRNEFDMLCISFADTVSLVNYDQKAGHGVFMPDTAQFKVNNSNSTIDISFYRTEFDSS
jgi:hypothetical protein